MNRKHILINGQKLNISNWLKWLMLIVIIYLSLTIISIVERILSNTINVSIESIAVVTFYIRGFIVLSLIYDLAPKFKKIISILWSVLAIFLYLGIDAKAGDRLFLGTLLYIIVIITYNIFLYRKDKA